MESYKENDVLEKKLLYAQEFKDVMRAHPGLIAIFRNFEQTLKNIHEARVDVSPDKEFVFDTQYVFDDGLKITLLDENGDESDPSPRLPLPYYKVEIDQHSYFVKTKVGYLDAHVPSSGVDEITSLREAREILKGMEGVGVVDFQLGYQDDKMNTSYFVTRWVDGTNLAEFLKSEADNELKSKLKKTADIAIEKLEESNFKDVTLRNMLYQPSTGKIIVFDVHKTQESIE